MRFRFWIFITIGIFIIGIAAGIMVSIAMPAGIIDIFSEQLQAFDELGSSLGPFQISTLIFIFFKNALALLLSFAFSPLLCLLPLLAILLNSALISFISVLVVEEESLAYLLAGLLPHGIFEIPAFVIGEAAALSFGVATILALFSRNSGMSLQNVFKRNLKYLLLAMVLLVPAAIMETYVTPLLL
jgi:stage II sporulation protein M